MTKLRDIVMSSERIKDLDDDEYLMLKKELGAIEIHGLEDYMMSMYTKNIKTSNKQNSMLAWVLNLTENKPICAIEYRGGSIPDIDVDIDADKRDELLNYVIGKYGIEYTAGVGTYGYMWARSAIRSAGRALGYDLDSVDKVAKAVPPMKQGKDWHVKEAIENSPELQSMINNEPKVATLVGWAEKIDKTINSRGQHAAGLIISSEPISNVVSTFRNPKGMPVTELTLNECEALGLVKMDMLSLRTLTIISNCLRLISEIKNIKLTPEEIPLDDIGTFDLLSSGKLLGVFQLEGANISSFTKNFKPRSLEDVTVISAGYRPKRFGSLCSNI